MQKYEIRSNRNPPKSSNYYSSVQASSVKNALFCKCTESRSEAKLHPVVDQVYKSPMYREWIKSITLKEAS